MKRVVALWLPHWPIERLWRAEPHLAPTRPDPAPLARAASPARATREGGWRPGARWALEEAHILPRRGNEAARDGASLLVTTHRVGSRIEIAAASPAAQAAGALPGMTLTSARALLPDLVARPADPAGDHAALLRVATLLARRCSPVVAFDGAAGLLIDASGVAHLHGGEVALARRLVRLFARHGFTTRVAIADTPGAAHALSRCGARAVAVCPPEEQARALAPLPPHALRLDERQRDLLATFGIATIGELAAMPRAPLTRRFGAELVARLDRALGRIAEPLDPIVPAEPIAIAQRFVEPIASAEAIAHWLAVLVPRLTHALAAGGLGARRIVLVADRVDHVQQRIRIGLARPSRDAAHILRLLLRRIEDVEPGYGIDALTLHLAAADPLGPEALAVRLDADAPPDLAPLIDTLATRGARTWRACPVESDVPERSVAARPPLDPPARVAAGPREDDVARLRRLGPLAPWSPLWPRPVRLLAWPERVDNVLYALPDQPPRRFSWRGVTHRIVRADGPERITGEWWRRDAERHAVRDYYRVEDEAGARFWLYRRGDGERAASGDLAWFLHGVFG